jgi:hypothetical protein
MSLVPRQGDVRVELVLEDPLAEDDVGLARIGNETPCLVCNKSVELITHGHEPIWIL